MRFVLLPTKEQPAAGEKQPSICALTNSLGPRGTCARKKLLSLTQSNLPTKFSKFADFFLLIFVQGKKAAVEIIFQLITTV
jgi:hypothetical protein